MAKKQVRTRRKKNKLRKHIVQVVLLSLIIFSIIFFIYQIIKLAINPTESFLVEEGKISKEESLIGYVIRDEKIIKSESQQNNLIKIKNEGEKVAVGESVFRYESDNEQELNNRINELNAEIEKAMEGQTNIFSSDIKALDNQIESKIGELRDKNNIQTIKEYKKDIDGYITKKAKISGELSPAGSYISNLIQERTQIDHEIHNNSNYENAPIGGIISYRVDGLEEVLTPDNFEVLTFEYLEGLGLTTGQIVSTSYKEGKIINNFECYIAVVTNTEEAKNAEVGDKLYIRLSGNQVIDAKVEYIKKEEEKFSGCS